MALKIRTFFVALMREDGRLLAVASLAGIGAFGTYLIVRSLGLVP